LSGFDGSVTYQSKSVRNTAFETEPKSNDWITNATKSNFKPSELRIKSKYYIFI